MKPFTAMGRFHKQPPGGQHFGNAISDPEGRDGSFIVRRTRSAILRDQKVMQSTHMAAQSYGFRAPRCLDCLCSGCDAACQNIYRPINWTQEATMVNVRIFFFLYLRGSFKCMIINYQLWCSAPALNFSSSWQLTHNASLAKTLLNFVPTVPRRRRAFTSWNRRGRLPQQFCEQCGHFLPPGHPVTSFLSRPISTVIPVALAFNQTKPLLSSITAVTKAIKRTARTSLCRIWKHPQRCFPPFGQKPGEA